MPKKISQLELAEDLTSNDLIQIVDIEDTDMAVSGTNKKCTAQLMSDELGKLMNVVSTGSTQSRKITDRFADVFSVKDFGASPTANASQNTNAFNSALSYIHNNGGGTLLVPSGVYDLSDTLLLGANTRIKCQTGVRLVRKHNNSMLNNSLGVTGSTTGYTGNGNIIIDGGIWDGNSIEYYDAFNHLSIGHCENVIIKNATFLDCVRAHSVDLSASRNVLIDNNKFLGFAKDQTSPDGYGTSVDTLGADREYSEAVQIDQNSSGSFSFGAIDGTQCENIFFTNNIVGPNPARSDNTFSSWGCGIGSHSSINNKYPKRIIIEGNNFIECIFAGVRPWKWVDVTITGNTFTQCVRGVHITPTSFDQTAANNVDGTPSGQGQAGYDYTITGNVFDSYSDIGVFFVSPNSFNVGEQPFYHSRVTVTGNTFSNGVNDSAFEANWVDGLTFTGNVFSNVFRGIELGYCRNSIISNNTLKDAVREFIFWSDSLPSSGLSGGSENAIISNNQISNVGYSAILISTTIANFGVTGNLIIGASTFAPTRYGINCSGGASNGLVANNTVLDGGAANKPDYSIYITNTCSNIALGPNKVFVGVTGDITNASTNSDRVVQGMTTINSVGQGETGRPGLLLKGFSGAEGEIAVPTSEGLSLGQFNESTGTYTALSELDSDGDFVLTQSGKGLIVTTPNGTAKYRIAIDNAGAITSTLIP